MPHRVLGVLRRVLGFLRRVLGVLRRVLGVLRRVIGVLVMGVTGVIGGQETRETRLYLRRGASPGGALVVGEVDEGGVDADLGEADQQERGAERKDAYVTQADRVCGRTRALRHLRTVAGR